MQACHWKAHNTFTNFYLKDLTWSDNDNNMYLGPVVAAQQVLDPSSLCGVYVRIRVSDFSDETTRPRDMLVFLKDSLSI